MDSIIIFLFCLLIWIPNLIILFSLRGKKPIKVKEDILFIEKLIFKCLLLLLYLVFYIFNLLDDGVGESGNKEKMTSNQYNIYKTEIISFNIYIVLLFANNFFLCIEDYFTYTNPNHYFNSIFHNSKYNLMYELITILFASAFSILYLYKDKKILHCFIIEKDKLNDWTKSYFFIITNPLILIFALFTSIIIIILYIVLKSRLKNIIFKAREKLFNIINQKIIYTLFYLIFILFNFSVFFLENKIKAGASVPIVVINTFLFLIAFSLEIFFELKTYSTSKFAQYKLKYTIIEKIGSLLKKEREEEYPTNAFLESILEEPSYNNNNNIYNIDDEEENDNSLLMPINNHDVELVLIYRNNIFIEDYFYYFYDYMMNITLSSLFQIYKDKKFSPSLQEINKLKNDFGSTESAIFGAEKPSNTFSNYSIKRIDSTEEDNLTAKGNHNNDEFVFVKNANKNDFLNSEEIFANTWNDFSNENLNVKIISYYTSKCVSNLIDKNFTSKIIRDSLNSHLTDTVNENDNSIKKSKNTLNNLSTSINNYLPYHSILACNAKEEYFLHLKNMSIKSYDKHLIFDIFESNDDEDISLDSKNSTNIKIAKMINRYFDYIKGVGVSVTFLPIVLGIFKVKINSFKSMLIYLSCNSLLENSPSSSYSLWQLIRFSLNNVKKVSSSKYRHSVLIGDDLIFDRKYALPSIKEDNDPSYNKVEIKNFLSFEDIIKHDIEYLNKSGTKYSNLLLMYFEYENVQKHELGGAIKIRKTEDNRAEIVNTTVTMPIMKEDDESDENLYIGGYPRKPESENDEKTKNQLLASEINNDIDNTKDNKDTSKNKGNEESKNEIDKNETNINENDKKSFEVKNRISDLNTNLNIEKNEKINNENISNEYNKENSKEKSDSINENLDIEYSKSVINKDSELRKSVASNNNSRFPSICGSLTNPDFIDDAMSFDEPSGRNKNNQGNDYHNMLNYSEKIKMNSYDGYFDAFNCMCLFSFENIFDLSTGCPCKSSNYNELEKNILNNFSNYTPRKHTCISKPKKSEKKE